MRWGIIPALLLLSAALTGCGRQNTAGLTEVMAEFDPATGRPVRVQVDNGKEYGRITVRFDPATGAVTWTAENVQAFKAHEIRAAVQQAGIGMAPEALEAITRAVLHTVGVL